MLVLGRRLNEEIRIGSEIVVSVVRVRGDEVRIGITAPRSVTILRGEICSPLTPDTSHLTPDAERPDAA